MTELQNPNNFSEDARINSDSMSAERAEISPPTRSGISGIQKIVMISKLECSQKLDPTIVLQQEIQKLQNKVATVTGKELRRTRDVLRLKIGQLKRMQEGNYGRTIPAEIVQKVENRDMGRDFGRPNHTCTKPGPPHHIKHFADFKGSHTRDNPHTVENLEAPCKDCHLLAHAMKIPSGVSIETFFRSTPSDAWARIETLWKKHREGDLAELMDSLTPIDYLSNG